MNAGRQAAQARWAPRAMSRPGNSGRKEGPTATAQPCDRCGQPGAQPAGDRFLCEDCRELQGSCCLEFGGDDLWSETGARPPSGAPSKDKPSTEKP